MLGLWNRSNIKSLLKDYDSKIKVIVYITNYGVDKSAFFYNSMQLLQANSLTTENSEKVFVYFLQWRRLIVET